MVRTRSNRVFNRLPSKKSFVTSKKVKFSAPRRTGHASGENEPVPLACLPSLAIVPYYKAPFCDEGDGVYSTPRGSTEYEDVDASGPSSPSPGVPNLGENRTSTYLPKFSKVAADKVFDEMPQRDNVPDLMQFATRPGFPSWSSCSHAFNQGSRAQFPPRVDNQKPESSSKKRSRPFNEDSQSPLVLSSDDEEEVPLEPVKPVKKKKVSLQSTKTSKEKGSPLPSRVTRSAAKSTASAPAQEVLGSPQADTTTSNVPGTSSTFSSGLNKQVWDSILQRKFLSERMIHEADFKELGIFELLKSQHLLGAVTKIQPYVKHVVYEFYANLVEGINNSASEMHHKVKVRDHVFDFSPSVINDFYECHRPVLNREVDSSVIISEITANVRRKWPPAKSFPAAELSLKYSALHKIALKNWMPSMHATGVKKPLAKLLFLIGTATSFDFGQLVFDQITSNAEATITHPVLPFPSLIYGILTKQRDVTKADELFEKASGLIRISRKLHLGKHVDDVQGEMSSDEDDTDAPSVAPSASGGDPTSSTQSTAAVLHAKTVQFLSKELVNLSAYESHLLREVKRVGHKKKEITALLGDLQSTSGVDAHGGTSK